MAYMYDVNRSLFANISEEVVDNDNIGGRNWSRRKVYQFNF